MGLPPVTRTSKVVLVSVLAASGLVVLACGGLGSLAFTVARDLPAAASSDAFLDQLGRGEVQAAYQSTSLAFRSMTTPEQFRAVIDRYPALTKATTRTSQEMRMYAANGGSQATIQSYLANANNTLSLSISLLSERGRWAVHGLNLP